MCCVILPFFGYHDLANNRGSKWTKKKKSMSMRASPTIVTVAKLAAAEQLSYASEKEMPCPMKI